MPDLEFPHLDSNRLPEPEEWLITVLLIALACPAMLMRQFRAGEVLVSCGTKAFPAAAEIQPMKELSMGPQLEDRIYPFVDQRLPLSELAMVEVPADLEKLLREQAALNGVEFPRGQPIEITCRTAEFPEATFLVYWPEDDEKLHMLAPKEFSRGRA